MIRALVSLISVSAAGAAGLLAQTSVRTAVLFENYSFDSLLVIRSISELSVPVVINARLGQAVDLTISGGYVRTDLKTRDPSQLGDQQLSGPVDTEIRLGYHLLPARLIVVATGEIPSGRKTVALDQLAILGALSSDIIGFSAANLGSGGNLGGGFVGAVPLGRWALGLGATYRYSMSYQPIADRPDTTLQPGGELRLRAGLEGPLARTTYLRVAGVFASRQKDRINQRTLHGVGNRFIGYLALNQGLGGNASLTLYAFDVFRSDPQIEPTAAGAAILPRGNLFAFGGSLALRLTDRTTLAPRFEYRSSALAQDTANTTLRRAGESWRVGAELRQDLSSAFSLVLQGSGVMGSVVQGASETGLAGYRFGAVVELRP
ncbi:hypothetical protein HRbin33_00446 [bacterium HR33]|nr:hypothetical protein HRbin33_00446 [bacterium HR33]